MSEIKEQENAGINIMQGEQDDPMLYDNYGLAFEPEDEFSDAPIEFEEMASGLETILRETYILACRYNRISPHYRTLCRHLEKNIKQMASVCVTKAVLEAKNIRCGGPDGMTIRELYSMVSLHFRKCKASFDQTCAEGYGFDMDRMDQICRWAFLAERLKATEAKIRKIRSGKVNADSLLERAECFRNEGSEKRSGRSRGELQRITSLPVLGSYARELVRKKRKAEAQKKRAARHTGGSGPYTGFRPPAVFRPESAGRSEKLAAALSRKDLAGRNQNAEDDWDPAIINNDMDRLFMDREENSERSHSSGMQLQFRGGISDATRKKLREARKKKKKR